MADIKVLGQVFSGVSKLHMQNASGEGTTEFSIGGGSVEAPENDVVFIDYDGSVLYSYSKTEFASLSALPANPVHEGLTAQGWNWTLEDAKTYVSSYGGLVIGQEYNVTDGKTHIFIDIPTTSKRKKFQIDIGFTGASGISADSLTIDWGDGNTTKSSSTSATKYNHEYANPGKYEIKISAAEAVTYYEPSSNGMVGQYNFTSSSNNALAELTTFVYEVWFGDKFRAGGSRFCKDMFNLRAALASNNMQRLSDTGNFPYYFENCVSLKGFVVHEKLASDTEGTETKIANYAFNKASGIKYVSFPKTYKTLNNYTLAECYSLRRAFLNSAVTAIPTDYVYNCRALDTFIIPENVTSLGNLSLAGAGFKELICLPESPPTISNANAMSYFPNDATIYVPYSEDHSILDTYKAAGTWSSYASQMVELPA